MSTKTEAGRAGHRELRSAFLAGLELRIRAEFWARWLPIESPGRPGRLSPLWERLDLDLSVGTAELRPQEAAELPVRHLPSCTHRTPTRRVEYSPTDRVVASPVLVISATPRRIIFA